MIHFFTSNSLNLLQFSYLLLFLYHVTAQNPIYATCNNNSSYNPESKYENNLNQVLTSLASNASSTGFHTTTAGEDPDKVYGLVQCRGNITKEDCQTCANNSILEIVRQCLNQKEAIIGYDNCRLWYSDWRFFSTANDIIRVIFLNFQTVPDPDHFRTQLGDLIDNLLVEAASDPSRFATGRTGYNNITDIYGMAQCTRDLTKTSCSSCLKEMVNNIPSCCVSKQGAQVISLSCNIRYDIYSFFQSPPSSPPAPILISAPPPLLEKNSTSSRTITTRSTREDGKRKTSRPVIIVVSTTVSVLVIVSITCSCLLLRKALRKRVDNLAKEKINSSYSLLYDLHTLTAATKNFSDANKLGEGGFGSVYKGKLHDGREIAVKRLSSNSGQGLEELRTEVELVAKLLHRNLARLLGFCLKEHEKLLVYEYLPNGSLDKILFDQRKHLTLGWERRYKIIIGIARGLLYLHEDSQLRIVHRDLKSSNILLDESLNPKISDFGLARLFHGSETQGNTKRIAGTYGYMAPEYAKHGYFSTKSDVFSFGVLVLEIVTGRKSSSFHDSMNLLSYAWQHWDNGTALDLTNPVLGDQVESSEVLKCIHIGLLCVQEAVADRPKISDVALMLSSYSVSSPVPSQPAFFVRAQRAESDLLRLREYPVINESGRSDMEIVPPSLNGVTVTELDPR